ncbi:unnamed protein product [Discosporangium mesarthrocarpum]
MKTVRFIFVCMVTVVFTKTVYGGSCLKTGHKSKHGTCNKDSDCCDNDAFCNKKGRCRLEEGEKCDRTRDCDGTMKCINDECRGKDDNNDNDGGSCDYKGCKGAKDDAIDWDCLLGSGSMDEVHSYGGKVEACDDAKSSEPCSTFKIDKGDERAEVKINSASDDYKLYKEEEWIVKYSFRPKKNMKVSDRFTHMGQIKPSKGKKMVGGDAICSISANNKGLHVRFSNQGGSINDYLNVGDQYIDWGKVAGNWVDVVIEMTLKESMKVTLSVGGDKKTWKWPSNEKPVAWSDKDMDSVRIKMGVYHAKGQVGDAEVEFKNVALIGPKDRMSRTSSPNDNSLVC